MPKLSIVSPVYNEQSCLPEFYRRLIEAVPRLTEDFEIILVDDGSSDLSWSLMRSFAERDPRVRPVRLSRNFGHHVAITAGLDHALGDWVVLMDSDLQDDPIDIPRLYNKAIEGFDIVVGLRVDRKLSPIRAASALVFYKLLRFLGDIEYDGRGGIFQIVSRRVVATVCSMREVSRFVPGLITWTGFPRAVIPVQHRARFAGKTKYSIGRLLALAMNTILIFSDRPLRLVSQFGLFISSIALIYGCYVAYRALLGEISVLGYASIVVSIFFVGGLTISTIGMVGIYVGAIYRQSMNRPLYVVMERLNVDPAFISRTGQA
jgi:dolichol-phosphate mannosyltransferase